MGQDQKINYRYSAAFKQKVVSEIESGKIRIEDARRIYGISGGSTIQEWIKKLGKNHLLSKVVRIEMRDEKDRIKGLEKEIRKLKTTLADEHIKNIALESLIEVADEHYSIDIKKNFGGKESKEVKKK
jgi:transposase